MPRRYLKHATQSPGTPEEWNIVQEAIENQLWKSIQRIWRHEKGPRPHNSVYIGFIGTAVMQYQLADLGLSNPADSRFTPESLASAGDNNLTSSIRAILKAPLVLPNPSRASFLLETNIGIATLALQRNQRSPNEYIISAFQFCKELIQRMVDLTARYENEVHESDNMFDDGCEILYGRAGLLYVLLSVRSTLDRKVIRGRWDDFDAMKVLTSDSNIDSIIKSIISRGKHGASLYSSEIGHGERRSSPPLMWMWYGKRYLGGAHGVGGVLHILLNSPFNLISGHLDEILRTIEWIIDLQDETGNWPTTAPGKYGREASGLVQWCHGAPGMLIMLSTVLRQSIRQPQFLIKNHLRDKIKTSLHRGAALVYREGLLRKGVGLCHGTAGSVYALLSVSDVLDFSSNSPYFTQAVHLAYLATSYEELTSGRDMKTPDHPWSLYEGLAGMCCAWGEILSRFKSSHARTCSGMPGFDDLGERVSLDD